MVNYTFGENVEPRGVDVRFARLAGFPPTIRSFAGLVLILLGMTWGASQAHADAPPAATPQSAEAIPFAELGAHAEKEAKGEGVSLVATPTGAELRTRFQHLVGTVDARGLWIRSTAPGEESQTPFQIVARRLGRTGQVGTPLAETGVVEVDGSVARFGRPGIVEEYSVSADGIRQDFLVFARPAGSGELQLDLAVTGATAQAAGAGRAELILSDSGRRIAYHRLHVTDAHGEVLDARMAVLSPNRLAIHVDDATATYPLRIDPTFTDSDWVSFGGIRGADSTVNAVASDSSGNIYIAGSFGAVGDVTANRVARWDGSSWHALGSGINNTVDALAVSGTDLYVGGIFSTAGGNPASNIARWDGANWHALGSGVSSRVWALAVDGTDLYVGGQFSAAGGSSALRIARWDGSSWHALGSGVNNDVFALAVDGTDLYVGGGFTTAGGNPANGIARWDGSSWHALGSGVISTVNALAINGGDLYVGGSFSTAGGSPASRIARWDGSSWHALGSGVNSTVYALAVSGTNLYVGGTFTAAGGSFASRIARWDGTNWHPLASGINSTVNALAVFGTDLFVGGAFSVAGGIAARRIARWDGASWHALGGGMNNDVYALAVDGVGNLYAGGGFTTAGVTSANRIARWDGAAWHALGSGVNATVLALAVDGTDLYVGGGFTSAGGSTANRIARWDGAAWNALGGGVSSTVWALAHSGTDLYVGGIFTTAGGSSANNIARWDGAAWNALGSGVDSAVYGLAVAGTDLYVGGGFSIAGGTSASRIARWDGAAWHALGSGVNSTVYGLAAAGTDVYVGGGFGSAGGNPASGIARWDGSNWHALGGGVNSTVYALAVSGTDLYVGGLFTFAGGNPASHIARWNGSSWQALGSGVNDTVWALALPGTDLYVGGEFTIAGNVASGYVAQANLPTNAAPAFDDDPGNDGTADTALTMNQNAPAQDLDTLLAITDTDSGDTLTWAVQTAPTNGSLGGFPDTASSTGGSVSPNGLTYTPTTGYSGADSFTIVVDDGWDSDVLTVNVTVNANAVPSFVTGATGALTVSENDGNRTIDSLLAVTDTDTGDTLTWTVTGAPTNGATGGFPYSTSSTGGAVTPVGLSYKPNASSTTADSFTVQVSDGIDTDTINIAITVTPAGTPSLGTTSFTNNIGADLIDEQASPQSLTVDNYRFTGLSNGNISLGNTSGNAVLEAPNGALVDEYRIASADGSEFQLDDFTVLMQSSTYDNIGSSNDMTVTGYRDGSPVSGASENFSLVQFSPNNADVSANTDFDSIDEFRLTFSSTTATGIFWIQDVTISAAVTNTAPTFDDDTNNDGTINATLAVGEDSGAAPINTLLTATDADGDNLTWSVVSGPGKGVLGGFNATDNSGNAASGVDPTGLTYTPNTDETGSDSFTVRVSDGTLHDDAVVNVTIQAAPDVNNMGVADGLYGLGDGIQVIVSFDQNITVSSGSPSLDLNVGGNVRTVTGGIASGSLMFFGYIVQAGDDDTDGIEIVANSLTGNIAGTTGGLAADLSHAAYNDGGETVDATPPTITAITRDTPTDALTNATTVVFRVTFSEVVTGVDTADFQLTGTATGSITAVASANSTDPDDVWLVTATGVAGDGTLGLELAP